MSREYTTSGKAVAADNYISKDNEPEPERDESVGYIFCDNCSAMVINQQGARCPYCGATND